MFRSFLCLVSLSLSGTALAWADCCDYPGIKIGIGGEPNSVRVIDLNSDGVDDLIVTPDADPQDVLVLESLDTGSGPTAFEAFDSFDTLDMATDARVADVTGDGHADLVATTSGFFGSGDSAIEVFAGDGSGGFSDTSTRVADSTESTLNDLHLVNVDGGNLDAVANQVDGLTPRGTVFFSGASSAAQTLTMAATTAGGSTLYSNKLYSTDLDGDGLTDLVSLNDTKVTWRLNTASGLSSGGLNSQRLVADTNDGGDTDLRYAAFGQLDSDANVEIAVTSYFENRVYIYEYDSGTLVQESISPMTPPGLDEVRGVEIGDITGDGDDDLVVSQTMTTNPGQTVLLPRTGDLTFGPESRSRSGGGRIIRAYGDNNLIAGDFSQRDLPVLSADATGRLLPFDGGAPKDKKLRQLIPGDFNEDGDVDLAVYNSNFERLRIMVGNNDGTFSLVNRGEDDFTNVLDGGGVAVIAGGNFNGDSHEDLIIANDRAASGCVFAPLFGAGDTSFSAGAQGQCGSTQSLTDMQSADLDGQNGTDLVILNDGALQAFLNPGTGDFSSVTGDIYSGATSVGLFTLADVDGVNGPDLVAARGADDEIRVHLNDGNGAFGSAQVTTLSSGHSATDLETGDFNNDGDQDLALLNFSGGADGVMVLFGNADGTFATTPSITAGAPDDAEDMEVADVNADGFADLWFTTGDNITPHGAQHSAVLLENQGGTSLDAIGSFAYDHNNGSPAFTALALDVDGDSDSDLVAGGSRGLRSYLREGSGVANRAPTGSDFTLSLTVGLSVSEDITDNGNFSDPDGDTLSYSASGLPTSLSLSGGGVLSGTPGATALDNEPHTVTINASDSDTDVGVQMTLEITNAAPTSSGVTDISVEVGDSINRDISGSFTDPDGHDLTFSATGLPGDFALSSDGTLTGTVDQTLIDGAPYSVEITATDSFGASSGPVTVEIGETSATVSGSAGGGGDGSSGGSIAWVMLALLTLCGLRRSGR